MSGIYTTTGGGAWANDGNDLRVNANQGTWLDKDGNEIYEAATVEDPPGVFTTEWAKIWDRYDNLPPTGYPTGSCSGTLLPSTPITDAPCLAKSGPAIIGPEDHTVNWDVPTGWPENGWQVQIEWWVNGGLDFTEYKAATAGSSTRVYNVEDDLYCILRYSSGGGLGADEVKTTTV